MLSNEDYKDVKGKMGVKKANTVKTATNDSKSKALDKAKKGSNKPKDNAKSVNSYMTSRGHRGRNF